MRGDYTHMCFPGREILVHVEAMNADFVYQTQLSSYLNKVDLVLLPKF